MREDPVYRVIEKYRALARKHDTRGWAIRAFCVECMGGISEVPACTSTNCNLYPFRLGSRRAGSRAAADSKGLKPEEGVTGHPGPELDEIEEDA